MTATRGLSQEEIARGLGQIREGALGAAFREFGENVPWADLENAYGDVTVEALERTFTTGSELAAFVRLALRRDVLDLVKSGAFRVALPPSGEAWNSVLAAESSPERAAIAGEARAWLGEFLAELAPEDRHIAFLALYCDWPARAIASELGLPHGEVTKTVHRVRAHVSRLSALALDGGKLCSRRRRDLLRWRQTGECPRALILHCYRCASCRARVREARAAARGAIAPLIPPTAAAPLAAHGALTRLYHAAATHSLTHRLNDSLARVRKAAPVGGGGGAAVAAKLALGGATVIATAGAALHAAVQGVGDAPLHHHRHHHPPLIARSQVRRAALFTTTSTPAPATTSTVPSTTTTTVPAPAPAVAVSSTSTSAQPVMPPAPDQTAPAPAPAPVTANATTPSSAPPAPTGASGHTTGSNPSTSSTSGPPAPGGPPPP